jgi:hypothetical protein
MPAEFQISQITRGGGLLSERRMLTLQRVLGPRLGLQRAIYLVIEDG